MYLGPRVRLAARGPAGPPGSSGVVTVTDTPSVNLTFAANDLQAEVLPAGVDHNALANLTAGDPHTQYHNDARALTWLNARNLDDLGDVIAPGVDGDILYHNGTSWVALPGPAIATRKLLGHDGPGGGGPTWDTISAADTTSINMSVSDDIIISAELLPGAFAPSTGLSVAAAGAQVALTLDTDLQELSSIANVRGDLIVTNAGPTWVRLAIGASGQFLGSDGTDAAWTAFAGHTAFTEAVQDVVAAVFMDADDPDTWTFTYDDTAGTVVFVPGPDFSLTHGHDHGTDLAGLADDDHTQYLLLAGRGASQAIQRGLSVTLSTQTDAFMWEAATTLTAAQTISQIAAGQTIAVNGGGGLRGLVVGGTFDVTGTAAGTSFLVFNFNPLIRLSTNADNLQNTEIYKSHGTIDIDANAAVGNIGGEYRNFIAQPEFTVSAVGGTALLPGFVGFRVAPVFNTGWSMNAGSFFRGFDFAPTGGGLAAVPNIIALDIASFTLGTTLNASLRSLGTAVQMQHAGPAKYGATGAPAAGAKLEVAGTDGSLLLPRLTNAQVAALAAAPDGAILYCTDAGALAVGAHQRRAGAWVAM